MKDIKEIMRDLIRLKGKGIESKGFVSSFLEQLPFKEDDWLILRRGKEEVGFNYSGDLWISKGGISLYLIPTDRTISEVGYYDCEYILKNLVSVESPIYRKFSGWQSLEEKADIIN